MWVRAFPNGRAALASLFLGVVLVALGGCQSTNTGNGTAVTTGSITPADGPLQPSVRALLKLRQAWARNPADRKTGLELAAELKRLGQNAQALEVLKKLVESNPADERLRHHYAGELLRANRPVPAEVQFRRLIAANARNWRYHDALGSALAAQGRFAEAEQAYRAALRLSPNNPRIINNLAMNHILAGHPKQAETLLKDALKWADRSTAPKLRQNLALALGLQGRFAEARYIASHDLPPAEVAANLAYLKKMLGSAQGWDKISGGRG